MGPKPNEWNDVTDLEHSEMFTTDSYRPAEALGSMGGHWSEVSDGARSTPVETS